MASGEEDQVGTGLFWRWVAGIGLSLLNCALSSTGFVMQRRAHLDEKQQEQELERQDLLTTDASSPTEVKDPAKSSRWLWVAGVFLYILAAFPDVVAYTLVPQVVCTTIACFRLVVVTVLAAIFLGEKAEAREVAGMLCCTLGTFLCLHWGPKPDEDQITAHVEEAGSQARLHTYLAIGMGVLLVLLILEHAALVGLKCGDSCHYFTLPVATGFAFALEKVFNTEIGLKMHGKSAEENIAKPIIWSMTAMIALLGLLDFYLNLRGAKVLPVAAFIPMAFAFATALQYFQSLVIFGEFAHMQPLDASISLLGASLALAGAVIIRPPRFSAVCEAGGNEDHELLDEDDDDDDDDDSTVESSKMTAAADGSTAGRRDGRWL